MKKAVVMAVAVATGLVPLSLWALHTPGAPEWDAQKLQQGVFTLEPAVGLASVSATELVYDDEISPGYMLSRLDWSASGVVPLGLAAGWRKGRFCAGAGVWQSVLSASGELTDQDWDDPRTPEWTHRTEHDAEVSITSWDLNAGWSLVQQDAFLADVLVGYGSDLFFWSESAGSGVHTVDRFRDTPVTFEDTGIEYEQDMSIPYAGLHLYGRLGPYNLSGHLLYSPLVAITAEDTHYGEDAADDILFTDTFEDADYVAAGAAGDTAIGELWRLRLGLQYQQVSRATGDSEADGDARENGAGTDSSVLMGTLSVFRGF